MQHTCTPRITALKRDVGRPHRKALGFWEFSLVLLLLLSFGCHREEPLTAADKLDHVTSQFDIFWPPIDPEEAVATSSKPLLNATLAVDAPEQLQEGTELRLAITITRPSAEADRQHWNTAFPFVDAAKETWSIFYFSPISDSRTKITIVGLGYTDSEQSKKMQAFFAQANKYSLDKLNQALQKKKSQQDSPK